MSAFFLYAQANRTCVKEENPDATFGQIACYLASQFKELPKQEVRKWVKKADCQRCATRKKCCIMFPLRTPTGVTKSHTTQRRIPWLPNAVEDANDAKVTAVEKNAVERVVDEQARAAAENNVELANVIANTAVAENSEHGVNGKIENTNATRETYPTLQHTIVPHSETSTIQCVLRTAATNPFFHSIHHVLETSVELRLMMNQLREQYPIVPSKRGRGRRSEFSTVDQCPQSYWQ
jgi:HMG (high mobility group) box